MSGNARMLVVLAVFFVVVLSCGFYIIRKHRRNNRERNRRVHETMAVLRPPGETLRRQADEIFEASLNWLMLGTCGLYFLVVAPLFVLHFLPDAHPPSLLLSSSALLVAGLIVLVRRCVTLLEERDNKRMGWFGECYVAEHLSRCAAKGCTVFHDVPISGPKWKANIDHVVVGPHGLAVVETKMRSKAADVAKGWVVEFDGERLSWPKHPHDVETVEQVKRNAEWIKNKIVHECGITVPVAQVIAIPEWTVKERVLTQPRVVNGSGAADAVCHALGVDTRPPLLSSAQVEEIRKVLDKLCRDVEF